MDTGNYRNRILIPLAKKLGLPKLNFQVLRRTMATLAQGKGSVKRKCCPSTPQNLSWTFQKHWETLRDL